MSRLVKTRGIVIRHSPTSETSRIIHWLTESHGRISTIAKGAMRPRNPFLGQFDQHYTCELIYYARDRDSLFITREISPIRVRPGFRTNWRAAMAAQYFSDTVFRITPQNEPVAEFYHLLENALDEIESGGWHPPMLHLFELRALEMLGLAPQLTQCATCGKTLKPGQPVMFATQRGGMLCRTCGSSDPTARTIGPDVIAILANWHQSQGWKAARSARCSSLQLQSIRSLLGDFLSYHLDLYPGVRDATLDLLLTEAALSARA